MDTRIKMLEWTSAEKMLASREEGDATKVVVGYFDPMLAAHARRLAGIAGDGKLMVLVTSPAAPLMTAEARAELVAALETVRHVAIVPAARLQDALRLIPASALILEQAADALRTGELIRRVHARQKA